MSRRKSIVPAYLLHKPTGQARVRINGRDFYLGPFGSPESRQKYGELVAQFAAGRIVDPFQPAAGHYHDSYHNSQPDPGPSIAEISLAFLRHADQHYRKGGKRTTEFDCFKSALNPLTAMYGETPAATFGPTMLKAVRAKMVERGWCRKFINKSIGRIRRVFRHGVENEMIDVAVVQRLETVAPLLAGRTEAVDYAPRQAVPPEQIAAVKEHLSERNRDLIDLQLLTGARPGELLMLTTGMIDRTPSVWVATIAGHKTEHLGKARRLRFGPRSQLILTKYLKADPTARLFPVQRRTYGDAVVRACEAAFGMPKELRNPDPEISAADLVLVRTRAAEWRRKHCWSPHWLRHNVATTVRDEQGLEAAQAMLGHAKPDMTAAYSRKMDKLATDVAAKCG